MARRHSSPVQRWNGIHEVYSSHDDHLAGDRELYALLKEEGFEGANYEEFKEVLIDYGYGVINGWVRGGKLLAECRRKGARGLPSDGLLFTEDLGRERQEDLVADIVVAGIHRFTNDSMRGGKWSPDGSASMKTYFIGGCLFSAVSYLAALAQELQEEKQRRELEQEVAQHYLSEQIPVDPQMSAADFADAVVDNARAQELWQRLSPQDRKLVEMRDSGLTYKQMASNLGSTRKGIESRLRRLRRDAEEWRKGVG